MDHGVSIIPRLLEILEIQIFYVLLLEIIAAGGLQGLGSGGLGLFLEYVLGISGYPGNLGNLIFVCFVICQQKHARRNFTQNPPINEPRSLI